MSFSVNPVGWFEIPVMELDRAQAFYEHVMQITLKRQTLNGRSMALFPDNELAVGAAGALVTTNMTAPHTGGIRVYLSTADINAALKRVVEKKGSVIDPIGPGGPNGYMASFLDPEGNQVGLLSPLL